MEKYFFLDYENVNYQGLEGISQLDETNHIYIFYSVAQKNMNIDVVQEILKTKAEVVFVNVKVTLERKEEYYHDALDGQLSSFLGYTLAKNGTDNAEYYIVAHDRGYDFIRNFWVERDYPIKIVDNVLCEVDFVPPRDVAKEEKELNTNGATGVELEILERIKDETIGKCVYRIVVEHKTKNGIHNCLVSQFGNDVGSHYYAKIKSLLVDKK